MTLSLNDEAPVSEPAMVNMTHLLNSNNPPDTSEAAAFQKEVDVLVPTVSRLRAQLKLAEAKLLQCRSVLSAIRKFPQEILVQLFTLALDRGDGKNWRGALVQLGRVSKTWYSAAYDPSLWADVALRLGDIGSPEDVEVMFKNSKAYPRTVTLQGHGCGCGNPEDPSQEWQYCFHPWRVAVTELLCQSSPVQRLVFANLSLRCFTNVMSSLSAEPHRVPQAWCSLRSLALHFENFPEYRIPLGSKKEIVTFDFGSLPPSLTSLSLKLPSCPRDVIPRLMINVDALKHLASLSLKCDWGVPDFLTSLRYSTNLTVLHLTDNRSQQSWLGFGHVCDPDVLLPKLHTLDFNIRDPKASATILLLLRLPALANLRIFASDDGDLRNALEHLRIISSEDSLAPRLCSLSIWFYSWMGVPSHRMKEKVLVDILSRIPSLRHLALDKIMFDARQFTDLIYQSMQRGEPHILPAIESIELADAQGMLDVFDIDAFLELVEVQRRPFQLQALVGAVRRPDPFRRITFGNRRRPDGSDFSYKRLVCPWELAARAIEQIEESYDVVVDRVFVSRDWKRLGP